MYSVKQNSDVIIKHNFAKQQFYSKSTEFRSDGDRDHHGGREDRDHHEEVGEDDREDREEEEEEPYL